MAEADAQDRKEIHDILSKGLTGESEAKGKKESGGLISGLHSAFSDAKPTHAAAEKDKGGAASSKDAGGKTGGGTGGASSKK